MLRRTADDEADRRRVRLPASSRGRPREVEFREVINAVRYLVRSGCGWRMLPAHFGHWRTVYGWVREVGRGLLFQTIHDVALMVTASGRDVKRALRRR